MALHATETPFTLVWKIWTEKNLNGCAFCLHKQLLKQYKFLYGKQYSKL